MSTLEPSADWAAASSGMTPTSAILEKVLAVLDERMRESVRTDFEAARGSVFAPGPSAQIVLVGHRAAGKSRVLPLVAQALGREAVDLDRHLERSSGRALHEWVSSDIASFRAAEREAFLALPPGRVVSVGGGFWSHHAQVLTGHVVVEVPVSFRTYRERLLSDELRPRLRPELPLEEEIRTVYRAREFAHRVLPHLTLGRLLAGVR